MEPQRRQTNLLEALRSHILIGDGAMTTLLHQSGVPLRSCSEEQNLLQPERVAEIHRAYVRAGANVIQTNTFAAHRPGLARYGVAHHIVDINRRAVELAKLAAGDKAWVLGTIGSIAGARPYAGTLDADVQAERTMAYAEQAEILVNAQPDGLLLETFPDVDDILLAIAAVRSITPTLPIFAHLSPDEVGVTRDGVPLAAAFASMVAAGADVVGLNCRLGPYGILRSYEGIDFRPEGLYGAMPNAGMLHLVEGDYSYTGNAQYFADTAVAMARLGVRFLGGCCGTTPEYIHRLAAQLRTDDGRGAETPNATPAARPPAASGLRSAAPLVARAVLDARPRPPLPESPRAGGTSGQGMLSLVDAVKNGTTVITELDPPKSLDWRKYLLGAQALQDAGCDFITLADNSMGSIRISNMALATQLEQMGIRTLVHVTCRDRNLIGQQSHLMGLHMLGIHHVLLITGDPSKYGDLPGATSVYDVSSIELTRMVKRMNEGIGFSGQALQPPAAFAIGTSFNPHVRHFDKALARLQRKIEAGADYVMTQPIYDERILEQMANATRDLGVPVFSGVMPLVSARNAIFLHNELPGIDIPKAILDAMQAADAAEASALGLAFARDMIDKTRAYFNGIYLITPFLRYELTVELTRYAKQGAAVAIHRE